jgi:hypothetical protein
VAAGVVRRPTHRVLLFVSVKSNTNIKFGLRWRRYSDDQLYV